MNEQRPRILVIDDDPLFRSLMSSILAKDYFVSVASSGSDGFYRAVEHPPDLAIIDIKMPGWDGLQTLKAFRTHPKLSKIQIVILTSDASKETVMAAIKGGANDYVIKTSLSKDTLCQKLDGLLETARAESQDDSAVNESSGVPKDHLEMASNGNDKTMQTTLPDHSEGVDSEIQELIDSWE